MNASKSAYTWLRRIAWALFALVVVLATLIGAAWVYLRLDRARDARHARALASRVKMRWSPHVAGTELSVDVSLTSEIPAVLHQCVVTADCAGAPTGLWGVLGNELDHTADLPPGRAVTFHLSLQTKMGEFPVPTCRDFLIMTLVSAGADSARIEFMNPPLNRSEDDPTVQVLLPPPDL
jgi:hypothetical protein